MVGRTVLAGSLALGALAGCAGPPSDGGPPPADPPLSPPEEAGAAGSGSSLPAVVSRVTDGDTIRVRVGGRSERVRLLGIDAPETQDPDAPVACFGPQAAARARALLPPGSAVTVVTDPTQDRRDRYGRLLAYVFPAGSHRPANEALVALGAARVYVYRRERPFRRLADFRRAETDARRAGRGLWGACPTR